MSPILASPLLHGDLCSLWLAETFCKNYLCDCMYSPCTKSHILPSPHPTLFGAVSQSHLKCYLSSYSPHLTPNKTTHNSEIVHFLQSTPASKLLPLQRPLVSALSLSSLSSSSGRATPQMSPSFPPSPRRFIPPTLLYKVVISLEPELSLGTVRSPADRCPQVAGAGEEGRKSDSSPWVRGFHSFFLPDSVFAETEALSPPHSRGPGPKALLVLGEHTALDLDLYLGDVGEGRLPAAPPRCARLCLSPPTSHPAGTSHPWRERPDHRGGPSS